MYRRKPVSIQPIQIENGAFQTGPSLGEDTSSRGSSSGSSGSSGSTSSGPAKARVQTYEIMWRKKTTKKNKTWDSDGIATYKNGTLFVKSDGKLLTKIPADAVDIGDILSRGAYEVEISSAIDPVVSPPAPKQPPAPPAPKQPSAAPAALAVPAAQAAPAPRQVLVPTRATTQPKASQKSLETVLGTQPPAKKLRPNQPPSFTDSLTTFKPLLEKEAPVKENELIDPLLLEVLRPHQREAVEFLYKCTIGSQHSYGHGGLLADEMGLGKTLVAISLIWSLLRHNKIRNCLIVCPVTLLNNWRNEFKKWLGESRIGVLVATPETDLSSFFTGSFKTYQVLIAGYERIRTIYSEMGDNMREFDLVICDEGHRLKSCNSKTAKNIAELSGDKRVILTGTPVQNNLAEFHSLGDFVNPGMFGTVAKFTRKFSDPIVASRVPDAPADVAEAGKEAADELIEIINEFVLRRDSSVLSKYVQVPKREFVVFCRPTSQQVSAYQNALSSSTISSCLDAFSAAQSLQAISLLRKVAWSLALVPAEMQHGWNGSSEHSGGKLLVLAKLLHEIYSKTDEKVVIVSGSTKMLDVVQNLCSNMKMMWQRLDGATAQKDRQTAVDLFNRTSQARSFAFLLSARGGGTGLNLIGASRLVLLDCDWNPAIDLQAMARIFRDGQKRPVFIYRFLTTGTIDEKIFQRQLSKVGLSDTILDLEPAAECFSKDQLKNLFSFTTPEKCDTLDCAGADKVHEVPSADLKTQDPLLAACTATVSCVLERN